MIARIWIGRTRKESAEAYTQVVRDTGINVMNSTPGNCGAWLMRRIDGDEAEFVLISLWESLESIRAFAGEKAERARYFPEDDEYLLERTDDVVHFEVVHAPRLA